MLEERVILLSVRVSEHLFGDDKSTAGSAGLGAHARIALGSVNYQRLVIRLFGM